MSGRMSFIAYTLSAVSGICLISGIAILSSGRRKINGEL